MEKEKIVEQIKRHEGFSGTPYKCPAGKTTIGYGRNLDAKPLSEEEAHFMLINDLNEVVYRVREKVVFYDDLDEARKGVLINMAFNLGVAGLMKFKKMLMSLHCKDYKRASEEMLDSKWAKQVGKRAIDLSEQMKTGKIT